MRCAFTFQFLAAALLLLDGVATAQVAPTLSGQPVDASSVTDGDWVAYRNVYREMILFEKYGKPKHFLQNHLRITPLDKATPTDGLRLTLVSKSIAMQLPLDSVGRTVFPLSRAAFDENAELRLNRKTGLFAYGPQLSIASRADGIYEAADLRTACEQALAYFRYLGQTWVSDRKCVGVQFSYVKGDADADVRFRRSDRSLTALSAKEGGAFPGDMVLSFKIISYRFADWPEAGQVITRTAPLAIAPLIEN
jgi:hypothetical protein